MREREHGYVVVGWGQPGATPGPRPAAPWSPVGRLEGVGDTPPHSLFWPTEDRRWASLWSLRANSGLISVRGKGVIFL